MAKAFTLIELAVVVALIGLAASLVAVQLGGFSDLAQLRAAAAHVDRVVHLARTEARISGMPRLIEYGRGADLRIRKPRLAGGAWTWDDGVVLPGPSGVPLTRLIPHDGEQYDEAGDARVRIQGTGRVPAHAVIVNAHDLWAVVSCGSGPRCDTHITVREPAATTMEHLEIELLSLTGEGHE